MRIHRRTFPDEVHLGGLDDFGALDNLPEPESDGREQQKGIVAEEGGIVPGEDKAGVSEREKDDGEPDQIDISQVRLTPALERECTSIDPLRLEATVEEDIGNDHGQIIDQTTGGTERDEPGC